MLESYSNLPTSDIKIKCVIAWWIALLIVEDGGCSLIVTKMTNPNIIKAAIVQSIRSQNQVFN